MGLLLAAVAGALPLPAVEPSVAAMALAHRLHPTPPAWLGGNSTAESSAKTITYRLLHTITPQGVGCDPKIDACRQAAERIAHEVADSLVKYRQIETEKILAVILDDKVSPENMKRIATFAATSAGEEFVAALMVYADPRLTSPEVGRKALALVGQSMPSNIKDMNDRFYDETKALTRDHPVIPPPPLPSRSNKNDH
jgi:hypothetical protein